MAAGEFLSPVSDAVLSIEPAKPARAARGLRFFRASFAHAAEGADVVILLFALWATVKTLIQDSFLSASLAQTLPAATACAVLWWAMREADVYRFSARSQVGGHMLKLAGALVLGGLAGAAMGALAALPSARPVEEGVEEAVLALGFAAALLVPAHLIYASLLGALTRAGHFALNVVVVGATDAARGLIERNARSGDLNVLGVFDDRLSRAPTSLAGALVLGDLDALLSWPQLPTVDRIIVAVSKASQDRTRVLIDRLRALPNKVVLLFDMDGLGAGPSTLAQVADAPAAYVSGAPENARRVFWKRVQDLVIGSIALMIFSPVMLLVALAIKLDSRGPVFFRQARHGSNNEIIRVWKFRSMRTETTDHRAERQVTAGDPRVTRVGRIIRKTSIDELPQLFNVLAGEMSLVGPRPHAVGMKTGDVESEKLVAEYAHRHRIKPGMTGWAQIHGSRGPVNTAEDVAERVRYDVEYIDRANFWLDLWIMAATIPCLIGDTRAIR